MDANLLHISYEGGVLEDTGPSTENMWRWTKSPENAGYPDLSGTDLPQWRYRCAGRC